MEPNGEISARLVSALVDLNISMESVSHARKCLHEMIDSGTPEECKTMAYAMRDEYALIAVRLHKLGAAFSVASHRVQTMIDNID
jgi:hypothetical protein